VGATDLARKPRKIEKQKKDDLNQYFPCWTINRNEKCVNVGGVHGEKVIWLGCVGPQSGLCGENRGGGNGCKRH